MKSFEHGDTITIYCINKTMSVKGFLNQIKAHSWGHSGVSVNLIKNKGTWHGDYYAGQDYGFRICTCRIVLFEKCMKVKSLRPIFTLN
jgi:hypothetical protein